MLRVSKILNRSIILQPHTSLEYDIRYLAAAAVTVDTFAMELDLPIPALEDVRPWIPKVNVGGDSENHTIALQVRKKFTVFFTSIIQCFS